MATPKELLGPNGPIFDGSTPFGGYTADVLTPGSGITGGTGTVYQSWVGQDGPYIKTVIYIKVVGLNSSAAGDIIGRNGQANCHIGQITDAVNGKIVRGQMSCRTAAATGDPDIDLYSAAEATGTEDAAVSGLTETQLVNNGASWTAGMSKIMTAVPAANEYLYLTAGGSGADATYTTGEFMIELWGFRA